MSFVHVARWLIDYGYMEGGGGFWSVMQMLEGWLMHVACGRGRLN